MSVDSLNSIEQEFDIKFGAKFGVPIGALLIEKYLKGKLSEESKEKALKIQKERIYYGTEER